MVGFAQYTSSASSGHDQDIEITKVDDIASLSCSTDTVSLNRPVCQDCTWPDLQCILMKIAISIRPSRLDRHGADKAATQKRLHRGVLHVLLHYNKGSNIYRNRYKVDSHPPQSLDVTLHHTPQDGP